MPGLSHGGQNKFGSPRSLLLTEVQGPLCSLLKSHVQEEADVHMGAGKLHVLSIFMDVILICVFSPLNRPCLI